MILAGCSGGGTSVSPHVATQPQPQSSGATAKGTLTFALSKKSTTYVSRTRKPKFVSPSTADATLFIDGAASGTRVTCAAFTGPTGTCTITWTSTAGPHTFAVEIDDGQNVLAEGAAPYVLTASLSQTLAPLALNGVAASFVMESETLSSSCSGPNPSCFTGTYAVADVDYNTIVTPGSVYDNGPLSVATGAGSTATFGQSFIGNGSGAGGLSGPDANGLDYEFTVWCAAGANGSFTLAFPPQVSAPPSGEVTAAGLTTYSLNYPSAVNALNWPVYVCTNGTISVSAGGAINEYTVPTLNSGPNAIVTGPDGALWFTEGVGNKIGRMTTSGAFTEYTIPTGVEGFFGTSDPTDIAVGPDGALWFTEAYGNNIGRITTGGSITEYPVPTAGAQPFGIVAGPDNALWFTEFVGGNIGRITTAGVVTNEYPTTTPNSGPWGITAGPDGNLWFVENVPPFNVGRITTGGVVTEYATPAIYPESIAVGSDNALWFSGIGRVTTAGVVNPTLYQIPSYSGTNSLASGPDGAIWFTEGQQNNIGRITTAGVFTEYPVPTPLSNPYGITAGPDGNVWFTEQASGPCQFGFCSHPNKIGRIVPP